MASGEFSISLIDRKSKSSTQRLTGVALTALNIAAQETAWGTLVTDTVNMSVGVLTRWSVGNVTAAANPVAPTAINSLRKNKLAVSYHDSTIGKRFTSQIPIADGTGLTFITGTDDLDLTAGATATYVGDFQAVVKSEFGNAVVIDKIRAIGRHV